jgi:hypothetical protein
MCDQQHHTSVHAAVAEMQVPRVRRINADVSNQFYTLDCICPQKSRWGVTSPCSHLWLPIEGVLALHCLLSLGKLQFVSKYRPGKAIAMKKNAVLSSETITTILAPTKNIHSSKSRRHNDTPTSNGIAHSRRQILYQLHAQHLARKLPRKD